VVQTAYQKDHKSSSLALASTFSRISGFGNRRAISIALAMVEKVVKKHTPYQQCAGQT
jgi:hypothetical protein